MEEYFLTEKKPIILLIVTVVFSVLMFSLDYSMLNISLPNVSKYFHVNVGVVAGLPMVYILVVTSSLLGFGKLGDIRGYKKIFIGGVLAFILGTIIASISPTLKILFLARIIQSIGEAMFSPVGIAMLTTFLPESLRGRALGVVALSQGLGLALGNAMAGLIVTHFSWHAIFLINIPIAVLIVVLAVRSVPTKQPEVHDKRFDIGGSVLIFIALATLLYALSSLQKIDASSNPAVWWCFAVSILAFIIFVFQEKKIGYPILDFKLFRNKDFTYANISAFFAVTTFMGFVFIAPFYFELVKKFSMMRTGIFLMIPALMMIFFAPVAGRVSDKIGSRILCTAGGFLEVIALILLSSLNAGSGVLLIVVSLLIFGIAGGIFLAPNNRLVMLEAPSDKQGVASGVYKISLNIGSVFGIAILPVIISRIAVGSAGKMHVMLSELRNNPAVLEPAFRGAFIFGIFMSAFAALFAFLAKDKKTG